MFPALVIEGGGDDDDDNNEDDEDDNDDDDDDENDEAEERRESPMRRHHSPKTSPEGAKVLQSWQATDDRVYRIIPPFSLIATHARHAI